MSRCNAVFWTEGKVLKGVVYIHISCIMSEKSNSTKIGRAIVLSFVLIMSVVAMPITGTVAATHGGDHVTIVGNESTPPAETVWQGQHIKVETGADPGTVVQLRTNPSEGNGTFESEYQTNDNGNFFIETEGLEGSSYKLVGDINGDNTDNTFATFEVYEHNLSVSMQDDETSVNNSETGDNTVTFQIDSNRATHSFYITEANDNLDAQEIEAIFQNSVDDANDSIETVEEEDRYRVDVSTSDGSIDLTGNFFDVAQGDYEFQFEATDSSAMASQQISVAQDDGANAEFDQSVYEGEQVGDNLVFTVNTESTDQFTVDVGDAEQDGYNGTATIEVDNVDSDSVKVVFNTYKAGFEDPFSLHEDSQSDASIVSQSDTDLNSRLEAGDYTMETSTVGQVNGISTLVLGDRSTGEATTHIAPNVSTFSDVEDIENSENLTEMSEVAMDDKFVFEVEASGLYGYLNDNATAADLAKDSTFAGDHGLYVELEERDPKPNTDARTLDVSDGTLITDEENDKFYLVYDQSAFDVSADKTYDFQFYVTENNAYVEDDDEGDALTNAQTASSSVTFVDREASFRNVNDDNVVEVPAQEDATIEADTTLAPGSEVTMLIKSESPNPFSTLTSVEVSDEQVISANLDLSIASNGQEFTVQVRELTDKMDAVAVEGEPQTYPVTINASSEGGEAIDANISVNGESVTATDGSAEVELQAGSYDLTASADGYQDVSQTIEVTEEGDNTFDLTMTEEPDTYMFTAVVNNEAGDAVSGAEVSVNGTTQMTDENGEVSFELENGDYTVEVSASDYQSTSQSVMVDGSDASATFTLTAEQTPEQTPAPEYEHTVTVVDSEGNAVEGATVTVDGESQTTNADGEATFNLESGDYEATIEANGQSYSDSITVDGADGSSEVAPAEDSSTEEGDNEDDDGGNGLGMIGLVLVVIAILAAGGIIYYKQN